MFSLSESRERKTEDRSRLRTLVPHPFPQNRPFCFVATANREPKNGCFSVLRPLFSVVRRPSSVFCRPGGSQQGDKTRSHPELGRQTPQRQWYSVSRHGRVGRRQACKERRTDDRRWTADRRPPRSPSSSSTNGRAGFLSSVLSPPIAAGWSSPVARQAHNLKAAGSNPAPATKIKPLKALRFRGLCCFWPPAEGLR